MSIAAVRGIGVAVITSTSSASPFSRQQVPLFDAEAMLLVDHGHSEARELDSAVDQRVGSHHDVDLATRQAFGDAAPLRAGGAVREERDPHRPFAQQRRVGGHDAALRAMRAS